MREASARHEVLHGDAVGSERRLRQEAQPPGELLRWELVDGLAVEGHLPRARRDEPREGFEERRLTAGVRTDDHREGTFGYRHVDAFDHHPVSVADHKSSTSELRHAATAFRPCPCSSVGPSARLPGKSSPGLGLPCEEPDEIEAADAHRDRADWERDAGERVLRDEVGDAQERGADKGRGDQIDG